MRLRIPILRRFRRGDTDGRPACSWRDRSAPPPPPAPAHAAGSAATATSSDRRAAGIPAPARRDRRSAAPAVAPHAAARPARRSVARCVMDATRDFQCDDVVASAPGAPACSTPSRAIGALRVLAGAARARAESPQAPEPGACAAASGIRESRSLTQSGSRVPAAINRHFMRTPPEFQAWAARFVALMSHNFSSP